ncbi:MAG: NADH-quinone oxidoreductase subunit L [Planctomycetes bacterium]|nr:NADH-quinone oxidoreductase subunit L [Planctomycetota bacterium]
MSDAGLLQVCLLLGVFVPLASFVFLALFGTKLPSQRARGEAPAAHDSHAGHDAHQPTPPSLGEPWAGYIATAAIGFSLLLAVFVLFKWWGFDGTTQAALTQQAADSAVLWTNIGRAAIEFGVKLDSLTIIMFLMVTLCSTCIHVFSIGYMARDPRFARFFTFMSLFCFSMLGLVISINLVFLFVFWELVGVCSYFLIGFFFEKKSASDAGIKAFVVNRVGDFGFMIGLGLTFTFVGAMSLDGAAAVFEAAAHQAGWVASMSDRAAAMLADAPEQVARASTLFTRHFWGVSLATWLGIGLFCGAIGKSAQFPLQVWLPDAMEGPTPVSALIHAATMVAAGVYLVARIFALLTPGAQMVIAVIGCITLTMAALIAIVQTDIKRVLAYSTLSQLGYMIFGLGVGAWIAALFHLLVHAFFKAMLFLCSGSVIAGCHHEQEMTRMGGLFPKMKVTAVTFLIAVLAISGAGIPWTSFGIGGFYSKDEILAVAYYRNHNWAKTGGEHEADHAGSGDSGRAVLARYSPAQEHGAPEQADPAHPEQHASDTGTAHAAAVGHGAEAQRDYAADYPLVQRLPWILYILPILVAYITPFYMGRCFILTFMGKPRDERIYAHAHEKPVMYVPLVVLAIMTLVSGWFLFRPLVAAAAPTAAPLVAAIDAGHGTEVAHRAHRALAPVVGFAFVVGLGLAFLVYRNGFVVAERVRALPGFRQAHHVLWNKFYFDHVYNFVFVAGTKVLALIMRLFDNWIIDGIVNTSAHLTERLSRFSGVVLDNLGVDGLVNGVGWLAWTIGGLFRRLQTGVIRNYVLLAAVAVAGLVIFISIDDRTAALIAALIPVIIAVVVLLWPRIGGGRRQFAGEVER